MGIALAFYLVLALGVLFGFCMAALFAAGGE